MAHTMSPDEYQELGKSYYKQKQYEKAAEAFTNGIEAAVRPTVSLFDYRAASHDKLQDYSSAMKDGREMIRLDKKDIRGYLRVGSLLQKVQKLDTAIDIYKYGMRNVPIDNADFKVLQQLHDKLTRQLSPTKAVDPFTILPAELVGMVMSHLSFRHLVSCLRVCKGWKLYLTQCPNLWTDLDFSYAKREVSRQFVRNAVKWSGARTKRVVVHRFRHPDVLRNIATACKGLEEVDFLSGGLLADTVIEVAQCGQNLRKLILHTDVSLDTITQILRFRPTLEHVEFLSIAYAERRPAWKGPFPNLRHLGLTYTFKVLSPHGPSTFADILEHTPHLEYLQVKGCAGMAAIPATSKLASLVPNLLEYTRHDLLPWFWPDLGNKIKKLDLRAAVSFAFPIAMPNHGPNPPAIVDTWELAKKSNFQELEFLSLQCFSHISSESLSALLDAYVDDAGTEYRFGDDALVASLQHFSLSDCDVSSNSPFFGPNGILTCSRRILSPALKSLDLSGLKVRDSDIEVLITHPTSLQTIDLSKTHITGAGVKMLVDSIPQLQLVKADDCSRITSRDIIQYAKERGVTVSIKMTEIKGGRKVRW